MRSGSVRHAKQRAEILTRAFLLCESGLKRFIGRFLYRADDVDELAQETFLRAYEACKTTDILKPEAYLFRVAKHLAFKQLDLKASRLTDFLEEVTDSQNLEGNHSLEEELMAEQQIARYCDAIATLPPQCRKVFLMRKVQAKRYQEIANTLSISLSAVEKHVAKGMSRFDDALATQEASSLLSPERHQVAADVANMVGDKPTRSPHDQ